MKRNIAVTLALSAMTVVALGVVATPALSAVEGQQKPAAKGAAATAITVYKSPT